MNISLTPELERRISQRVESGLYTTASEVVREALRLLFAEDQERERLKAKFDALIEEALGEVERGEVFDVDDVYRETTEIIEAHRRKAG
jgi:antitoxin ParD1/3/4